MTMRHATRTLVTPSTPVARVQDPAVREILRIVSRSLKAICAAIDRHTGPEAADDS